jgi:hypothetical protein
LRDGGGGDVAIVDFGDAYLLDKNERIIVNWVQRWASNWDFRSSGWLRGWREGGDPEAEIAACLEMDGGREVEDS